ncbi:hypothetical protein FRC07_012951, partial [Ceratobasidium sp. 392]
MVNYVTSMTKLLDHVMIKLDYPLPEKCQDKEPLLKEIFALVQDYAARVHVMLNEYQGGQEVEHYYHYLLDVSYDISWEALDKVVIDLMKKHKATLMVEIKKHKKLRHQDTRICKNAHMKELGKMFGLRSVGHLDPKRTPFNIVCVNAYTHHPLESLNIIINSVNNNNAHVVPEPLVAALKNPQKTTNDKAKPKAGKGKAASKDDPKVPPPALASPFPAEGFVDKAMLTAAKFTIHNYRTIYGFAKCTDGTYSMVWVVQFCPIGSFSNIKQEAVNVFLEYMKLIEPHAHKVKNNRAANGNKSKRTEGQASRVIMNMGVKLKH